MPDTSNVLKWDEEGTRLYNVGVSNVALYINEETSTPGTYKWNGYAWSGVSSIAVSPEGADANPIYADNMKYLNIVAAEDYKGTIEAYQYPDQFNACMGREELVAGSGAYIGQQARITFGLAFKSLIGSDDKGMKKGYKLHILYGCTAAPSEETYETVNESPEPDPMSWELSTTPVTVTGKSATAYICLDSTKVNSTKLAAIEAKLFGSDEAGGGTAELLMPDDIADILSAT